MHRSAWIVLTWSGLVVVGACQVISGGDDFTFGAGGGATTTTTGPGGGGGAPECSDPEDCPGPAGPPATCLERICDEGTCKVVASPATTTCADATVCDGSGSCVDCLAARGEPCAEAGKECTGPPHYKCVPSHCFNCEEDTLEGETGIDCGGRCGPCLEGGGCETADDCASGYCAEVEGTGGAGGDGAGGAGGAGGGHEGGGCPGAGTSSGAVDKICKPCEAHPDCAEKGDSFCDDGVCKPKLDLGAECQSDAGRCLSGFCRDGVCCDVACTSQCRDCVFAATGQPSGTCAPTKKCSIDDGCSGLNACNGNGSCAALAGLLSCF